MTHVKTSEEVGDELAPKKWEDLRLDFRRQRISAGGAFAVLWGRSTCRCPWSVGVRYRGTPHAGPWRVTPLHGSPSTNPRWGLIAAGERPPRFSLQEPDIAFLTSAALTLADRPIRFKFLRDAAGTLHLMHDGHSVGTAAPGAERGEQLSLLLTALANLPAQPEALAHFLLAVPDEVLRRCGVILAGLAMGEER